MSSSGHFESDAELRRYEALLEMADLVVRHQSLPELFVAMAARLRRVTAADVANFSLYDPSKNTMRDLWHGDERIPAQLDVPVEESPAGWAWQNQQPLIMPDLTSEARFPAVLGILRENGLRSYCWLPLSTAQKRLGAMGLGELRNQCLQRKRRPASRASGGIGGGGSRKYPGA